MGTRRGWLPTVHPSRRGARLPRQAAWRPFDPPLAETQVRAIDRSPPSGARRPEFSARCPNSAANSPSSKQRRTKRVKSAPHVDHHGGIAGQHRRHDVAEVAGVGAQTRRRRRRRPARSCFDHRDGEAPSHKGDLRRPPPGPQLANRVDQQHRAPLGRSPPTPPPRIVSMVRRCQGRPEASNIRATASKRSGCRGTNTSRKSGHGGASRDRRPGRWPLRAPACCRPKRRRRRRRSRLAAASRRVAGCRARLGTVILHRAGDVDRIGPAPKGRKRSA